MKDSNSLSARLQKQAATLQGIQRTRKSCKNADLRWWTLSGSCNFAQSFPQAGFGPALRGVSRTKQRRLPSTLMTVSRVLDQGSYDDLAGRNTIFQRVAEHA